MSETIQNNQTTDEEQMEDKNYIRLIMREFILNKFDLHNISERYRTMTNKNLKLSRDNVDFIYDNLMDILNILKIND